MESNGLELTVIDAGIGFDGKAPARLGLASMQERVRLLKGKLTVDSRPDHGTKVRAWVPCGETDVK
jgi:signal transduction histidine kinase